MYDSLGEKAAKSIVTVRSQRQQDPPIRQLKPQ